MLPPTTEEEEQILGENPEAMVGDGQGGSGADKPQVTTAAVKASKIKKSSVSPKLDKGNLVKFYNA